MKPLQLDGLTFDKSLIEVLKNDVKDLRDEALKQGEMNYSLSLSMVHALLNYCQEQLDSKRLEHLEIALKESVKLQSFYAEQLNIYDSGRRKQFKDSDEWIARLKQTKSIKE